MKLNDISALNMVIFNTRFYEIIRDNIYNNMISKYITFVNNKINEGLGINNLIKITVDDIWQLFIKNGYDKITKFTFGDDKLGFTDLSILFILKNNYNSHITIPNGKYQIVLGIPINGKEDRIKEVISHELTHLVELLNLNGKGFPKYNNIKKALVAFNTTDKKLTDIKYFIYKTLDNEINANVAQTYIYLKNLGMLPYSEYLEKLLIYPTYVEYSNISKLSPTLLVKNIDISELKEFNDLLIKNDVKTIDTTNVSDWIDFWNAIFKKKANLYLKKSKRIISEIQNDYKHYEEYSNDISELDNNTIDYTKYI